MCSLQWHSVTEEEVMSTVLNIALDNLENFSNLTNL